MYDGGCVFICGQDVFSFFKQLIASQMIGVRCRHTGRASHGTAFTLFLLTCLLCVVFCAGATRTRWKKASGRIVIGSISCAYRHPSHSQPVEDEQVDKMQHFFIELIISLAELGIGGS